MGLSRRRFLQQTGGTLAAMGASDGLLSLVFTRYQQALAQPTNRKLALLVGVNQYSSAPLSGCITDVELQRELLIYRFGFQPADILVLTDQQASKKQVETAFVEHLVKQATSGDVVVFHFSGYGRRVQVGETPETETTQPALVLANNSSLPQEDQAGTDNLVQETLYLLLRSLRTDQVTTVLDTSYTFTGASLQGNLQGRAYPASTPAKLSASELQVQHTLTQPGQKLLTLLSNQKSFAQMSGVVLLATAPGQMATEAQWDGFTAGLFSYALTQQLWQATPANRLHIVLRQASEQMSYLLRQTSQPQLSGQKQLETALQPYFIAPMPTAGVDGVVTSLEPDSNNVRLWLGGIAAPVLEQLAPSSILTIAVIEPASPADTPVRLRLTERMGLTAKAIPLGASDLALKDTIQPGQWVREQIRVLPRSIGLTLALDADLERIERVDAISALSALPWVTTALAGEQAADYLLSKVPSGGSVQIAALPSAPLSDLANSTTAPTVGGYGLFSQSGEIIPTTIGESGEAIKGAVKRLLPKLQTLLAVKYLTLAVNSESSRLPMRVSIERLDDKGAQVLLQQQTFAALSNPSKLGSRQSEAQILMLSAGSRLHYRLENLSQKTLYALLFQLSTNGDLVAVYTPTRSAETNGLTGGVVTPGSTLTLPPNSSAFEWIVRKPDGISEAFILCSIAPFTQTLNLLATGLNTAGETIVMGKPANPLEVSQAVLQDLHQTSKKQPLLTELPTDLVSLNCDVWAGFRFAYEVTA